MKPYIPKMGILGAECRIYLNKRDFMTLSKDQEIIRLLAQAETLYYRLVLVVGPSGSKKTMLLNRLVDTEGWHAINLNLELSRCMLELTQRQRPLRVQKLLDGIVERTNGPVVVLDNTEILFDSLLKLDPLRMLQAISRNRSVVASWNGSVEDGYLTYAIPDHPEFKRYPSHDLLLIKIDKFLSVPVNMRISQ